MIVSGIEAYTIFTYMCGDIQWSTIGTESAVVGYNAGGEYTYNVHGSSFSSIGELVSCTVSTNAQSKRETSQSELTFQMSINFAIKVEHKKCNTSIYADEVLVNSGGCSCLDGFSCLDGCNPNQTVPELEPCPCTLQQADKDCRFTRDKFISPNKMCFIQKIPHTCQEYYTRVAFVQQCCYNPDPDIG